MSFTPTQISGCVLWLDAMDPTNFSLSGSVITSWIDKSGRGFNATPFNSPTYSNSAANLAGTAYFRGTTSIASGTLVTTAFCIATTPSSFNAQQNRLLSATSGATNDFNSPTGFVYSAINPTGTSFAYRSLNCQTVTTVPVSTRYMTTTLYDATGGFIHSLNGNYPNGNGNSWAFQINSSNTNALTTYYLGVAWNGSVNTGQSWKGLVHEMLIFNRTLTQAQYQQVEGYLAWKWGLQNSLPSNHPYYRFSPLSFITNPTQLTLINTTFNPGTVLLPSSFTVPGRNLIFKDITGAFSTNTLTLTTNNANQRIDSLYTSTINSSRLGWNNFMAGDNNNWFTVGGTTINTINTSTMNALNMNTNFISSGNTLVSSLGFVDQTWANSTNSVYVQSTFMFYQFGGQSTIISGTRQSFGGTFLTTRTPFSPTQIAGLTLWLDAADQNTVALTSNISWRDKASGIRFATFGGTNTTYSNNFVNLASSGYLSNVGGSITTGQTFSFFMVLQNTGNPLANSSAFLATPSANNAGVFIQFPQVATSNTYRFLYRSPASNIGGTNSFLLYTTSVPSPLTMMSYYRSTFGASYQLATGINGGTPVTTNDAQTTALAPCTILVLGANSANAPYFTGSYAEIVFYSTFLNTTQRQQMEGYLAWKWGLVGELPATHPYKYTPP